MAKKNRKPDETKDAASKQAKTAKQALNKARGPAETKRRR